MVLKHLSRSFLTGLVVISFLVPGFSEDITSAPAPLQTALFLKLLAFNKNISTSGSVTVYVVGAPEFAAEMKKAEGKPIGTATLGKVVEGTGVPSEKPSVIYVGSEASLAALVAYTKGNKVLSITGNPDLASKDISLIVGISDAKPKIMINLSSSKDEGIDWNPAILKVAATIK